MREDGINRIKVHVAGFSFIDDQIIIARRSPDRKLYPELW